MRKHSGSLRIGGLRVAAALCLALLVSAHEAQAQLRIVTWNTATAQASGVQTPRTGSDIVLESIGEELINGVQRPIDVLLLQEQFDLSGTTQAFADMLNGIYGTPEIPTPYKRSVIAGQVSAVNGDGGRPALIWNSTTVDRIDETAFGTVNGSNQARSTMFYQIRPVGYDSTADFFAYNSHYKAGTTASDKDRRNIEATSIRQNPFYGSDNIHPAAHALFVGDYNIQNSSEASYQTLLAAGVGQAIDPISTPGSWHDQAGYAPIHTQSPCSTSCGDLTTGGMDDRFDFQLMTSEFLDDEGLSYISGSYRGFGNNGTSFDTNINSAANLSAVTGYPFTGTSTYTRTQILNSLKTASDHIPVVADYQLPAILSVLADSVPATLNLGDMFDLDVTVWNSAPVDVAIGADELDYSLTSSGDLSGEFLSQMDLALGGMNVHSVGFDTSTIGMKTGVITVSSSSQMVGSGAGVVGGMWTLNVMYEVLAAAGLAGDYNENDVIDAADYAVWRDAMTAGLTTLPNRDPSNSGPVDEDDFTYWRAHFGETLGTGAGSAAAVPEPSTWVMLLLGACLARLAGGKLGSWTRRS